MALASILFLTPCLIQAIVLQGGENCTHDYLMVSPTGNSSFADGEKYCGAELPVILSKNNKLLIKFKSDDLFR